MTDQEVICSFMELPPIGMRLVEIDGWTQQADFSEKYWWMWFTPRNPNTGDPRDAKGDRYWKPRPLNLDSLHEVEERLTHAQVRLYIQELYRVTLSPDGVGRQDWRLLHASAEQKIRALASVLRESEVA